MKHARSYWLALTLFALTALGGMAWVTVRVCDLETAAHATQRESEHRDALRLALWRMDSWLNARLAPEAARPSFHYRAYHTPQRAYSRAYAPIASGEVVTPSPLLTFRSALFPIHFEITAKGPLSSPQLPRGNERDLAEASLDLDLAYAEQESRLEELEPYLSYTELGARLGKAELKLMACMASPTEPLGSGDSPDFRNRARQSVDAQTVFEQQTSWNSLDTTTVLTGPLLPVWSSSTAPAATDDRLLFVRRVDLASGTVYQGFAVDFDVLQQSLREHVADLFPADALRFERDAIADPGSDPRMLTSVPLRVFATLPPTAQSTWSPTRTVLGVAWGALLLAILAVGATLGSALSFGTRRARFASAVTHELRSPLTTFRMYSEMLAEGMVQDEDKRREYLETLCRESDRLAHLVENVLSYARIEDGRSRVQRERTTASELFERALPVLNRRAEEAEFELHTQPDDETLPTVHTDTAVVEQILFTLVDNACKYAREDASERRLDLTACVSSSGQMLELRVRDFGPGVPDAQQRGIFRAFERGERPAGESEIPGVGLGLAVARGLARELGGELVLDPTVSPGACFALRLPCGDEPAS